MCRRPWRPPLQIFVSRGSVCDRLRLPATTRPSRAKSMRQRHDCNLHRLRPTYDISYPRKPARSCATPHPRILHILVFLGQGPYFEGVSDIFLDLFHHSILRPTSNILVTMWTPYPKRTHAIYRIQVLHPAVASPLARIYLTPVYGVSRRAPASPWWPPP
ncbi:hypothetical protein EDB92DRAFT_1127787 [Lactarius akahatsu]|uniref:Uncharacterized protein n=1 Tax=Lactarius akahatsu TaxID=416441 RepID=A0AAD4LDW4_9AGAM|nr:hypothetical protein EDB92DRAFT_1127787 [Lactarius akahatsu]